MTSPTLKDAPKIVSRKYSDMKKRCAEKRDKNNRIIRVGSELPFSIEQFRRWLHGLFGATLGGVTRCAYCNRPIDIFSFSPDHAVPLRRGGSSGLENLCACCETCNQAKGKLTADEFKAFLGAMELLRKTFMDGIAVRDIMHRLASARKAANSLNFMRAKAAKAQQAKENF